LKVFLVLRQYSPELMLMPGGSDLSVLKFLLSEKILSDDKPEPLNPSPSAGQSNHDDFLSLFRDQDAASDI